MWPAVARASWPRWWGRDAPTTAAGTAALPLLPFSYRSQPANCFPRSRQKQRPELTLFERDRRTESQGAYERHGQKLSLGKNTIQIVQIGWDEAQPWALAAEMVEATLESRHLFAGAARTLLWPFLLVTIPARAWRLLVVWLIFSLAGFSLRKLGRESLAPVLHAIF